MSIIGSFSQLVGTWFGYVGSCVVGSDPTCRPFLAFVAVAAVSLIAFAFLVKAYRVIDRGDAHEQAEREAQLREREMRARVRRTLQANTVTGTRGRRGWHVPA